MSHYMPLLKAPATVFCKDLPPNITYIIRTAQTSSIYVIHVIYIVWHLPHPSVFSPPSSPHHFHLHQQSLAQKHIHHFHAPSISCLVIYLLISHSFIMRDVYFFFSISTFDLLTSIVFCVTVSSRLRLQAKPESGRKHVGRPKRGSTQRKPVPEGRFCHNARSADIQTRTVQAPHFQCLPSKPVPLDASSLAWYCFHGKPADRWRWRTMSQAGIADHEPGERCKAASAFCFGSLIDESLSKGFHGGRARKGCYGGALWFQTPGSILSEVPDLGGHASK